MYVQQFHRPSFANSQSSIMEISGEGETAVSPNLAYVNLGVVNEGNEVIRVQQQNNAVAGKVISVLLQHGIAKKDIQTFDYRIDSQYDFDEGKQIFRGYKVTNLLRVKVENLSSIGDIIDTAVQQGANYVADVQFSAANKEAYYQESLVKAMVSAQEKAKAMAAGLHAALQPIPVYIIEGSNQEQPVHYQPFPVVKGISSSPFSPGQLLVKARITAFFRYTP